MARKNGPKAKAPKPKSGAKVKSGPKTQRGPKAKVIGNRWAGPGMMICAVIGLIWIVLFYVTNGTEFTLPVMSDLGNWNLVVGMGFIMAAFGFAMKWE